MTAFNHRPRATSRPGYGGPVSRQEPPPRVALVTGAGSHLGSAVRARLDADGFVTVGGWRSTEPPGPRSLRFDTTDADEVDAAIATVEARWGPIHTVVANAGSAHLDLAVRLSPERFRAVVDANLTGAFLLARAALPAMMRRRSGRIVFIGSVAGHTGIPGVGAYAAAKSALTGLARSLATEAGRRGVTVNVVSPGLLDSAVERLVDHRPTRQIEATWIADTPARREGSSDEVAAAVGFLASDRARSITGATIAIDGGFGMGVA